MPASKLIRHQLHSAMFALAAMLLGPGSAQAQTQVAPTPIPPVFTRMSASAAAIAPVFRGRSVVDVFRPAFDSPGLGSNGRLGPLKWSAKDRSSASRPTKKTEEDDDEDDDEEAPRKPGTLSRGYVTVPDPTPFLKRSGPALGPHLEPMREFDITDRTSIGVIGQADRMETRLGGTNATKGAVAIGPTGATNNRARDMGVGLSLQFKLGN